MGCSWRTKRRPTYSCGSDDGDAIRARCEGIEESSGRTWQSRSRQIGLLGNGSIPRPFRLHQHGAGSVIRWCDVLKNLRKIPKGVRRPRKASAQYSRSNQQLICAKARPAVALESPMFSQRFVFGPFVFDVGRTTLSRDGMPLQVGHRGLAILQALLRARSQIVTKDELMDAAWPGAIVEESNLSVPVAALRKLLGRDSDGSDWIVTVPRVGYRFSPLVSVDESKGERAAPPDSTSAGRKPSIAVLPFTNLSAQAGEEYFADGVTEEIINALSRFRWFFVIARHSSFRFRGAAGDLKQIERELDVQYVLTGSMRKAGTQVRVCAELIDARSAHQLWADRYDAQLDDMFAVQDRIAEQVAGAIEPELLKTESVIAAKRSHVADAHAPELVYQGTWFFHQVTKATHLRARELFRRALDLDADSPEANIWLARVDAGLVAYGWSNDAQGDLLEGVDAALRAVQFDEKNPYAHYGLAITSTYAGLLEQAERAAEKALELSPSFALGYLVLGMARLFSGQPDQAIEPLQHGLRINPYDPQNFVWYNALAMAHLFTGSPDQARDSAFKALKVRPVWRPTLETLACCNVLLDDLNAAQANVEQLAGRDKAAVDVFAPMRRRNPEWADRLSALLAKAGLRG
jgi:TolB-like protein/Flp pilus assembly protein TadD